MEEIKGKVLEEVQRWEGDVVLLDVRLEGDGFNTLPAVIKTTAEEGEVFPGLWYRFYGRWVEHYRYGPQFHASTFISMRPLDPEGMVAYLVRAPWIGRRIAEKLHAIYGDDVLESIRSEPLEVASQVRGLTPERAEEAAAWLEKEKNLEEATIDLLGIIAGSKLPRTTVKRAIRAWGNRAADFVRRNPYLLMRFRGCGFKLTDELYLSLGGDPTALKRQALCAWFRCASDRNGDTWLAGREVKTAIEDKVAAAELRVRDAVRLALRAGLLELHRDDHQRIWLAEGARSRAEARLADRVAAMLEYSESAWPTLLGLDISDHQSWELQKALAGRLGLFVGSPGTGKTYTAARLIASLPLAHVAVVAPTGKAAVRITEALEAYGIPIQASTIHSLLGVNEASDNDDRAQSGGFSFDRSESNPLDQRYVVCDEASMLDTWLLGKLVAALRPDGHLLLIGDTNQLPPVGHGAPLRDLLAAGVPYGELTEIRRNSGRIVETCAQIRDELPIEFPRRLNVEGGGNLMIRYKRGGTGDQIRADLFSVLERLEAGRRFHPVWETQILCAVNEKSVLGRRALNGRLQTLLNSRNKPKKDSPFWREDKVVCLRNSFVAPAKDFMTSEDLNDEALGVNAEGKVYVANGELGRVVEDEPKRVMVEFSAPRRVVFFFKEECAEDRRLDLGYALSCHKSQGSEWPIVLVVLDPYPGARTICDRSWLYTAISRARHACILFGDEETARDMIRRVKIKRRKTFLVDRIETSALLIQQYRETAGGGSSDDQDRPPWESPVAVQSVG